MQRAGDGDVVQVMACRVRECAGLAPAGHAAINELRIAREHDIRPEAVAFHHAGAEAFDQAVRFFQQFQRGFDVGRILQVQTDRAAAAACHIGGAAGAAVARAVNPDHVGAHVRQQHAAERARPDPSKLNDFDAGQWSLCHLLSLSKA